MTPLQEDGQVASAWCHVATAQLRVTYAKMWTREQKLSDDSTPPKVWQDIYSSCSSKNKDNMKTTVTATAEQNSTRTMYCNDSVVVVFLVFLTVMLPEFCL